MEKRTFKDPKLARLVHIIEKIPNYETDQTLMKEVETLQAYFANVAQTDEAMSADERLERNIQLCLDFKCGMSLRELSWKYELTPLTVRELLMELGMSR